MYVAYINHNHEKLYSIYLKKKKKLYSNLFDYDFRFPPVSSIPYIEVLYVVFGHCGPVHFPNCFCLLSKIL